MAYKYAWKRKAYYKMWYAKNRERILAKGRAYYRKHKKKHNACSAAWQRNNVERYRFLQRRWGRKNRPALNREIRRKIFEILGGCKCARCGFTDMRALQIDHIRGDGRKEGRNRNLGRCWAFVRKHPKTARKLFQVLCASCNWIKRAERKEHGGGRRMYA